MTVKTGTGPLSFLHRDDLHVLPVDAVLHEVDLHGTFAEDRRGSSRDIYYGMPGYDLIRISSDMTQQTRVSMPQDLQPHNVHNTQIVQVGADWRFMLTFNDAETIAFTTLDSELDFSIGRPTLSPYASDDVPYKPTDAALVGDRLYIADGYGAQYILIYDMKARQWVGSFGGATESPDENGKFRTAHGIATTHDGQNLVIVDRWNSRLQVHDFDGGFVASYKLPWNAWPCGIDIIEWDGQPLAVVACLYDTDEEKESSAPIYILNAETYEVLSTLRPKQDLGIDLAQRMHNASWHTHDGKLYLMCQSWNPGHFFVLECVR
jgi:hypothetical protein